MKLARHLFPVLLGLSALAIVIASAHDAQAEDRRGDAKKHYLEGKRLFEVGDYEKAIDEFAAADELAPSGINDYNIALSYEKLGKPAEAIRFYDSYLSRTPNAENKTDVKKYIDRLQQQMAAEEAAHAAEEEAARKRPPPPDGDVPPPDVAPPAATGDPELDRVSAIDVNAIRDQRETAAPPPVPNAGNGQQGGGPPPPTGPAPAGEPKKSKPIYKQWWFWVVAGVSAYVLYSIVSSNSEPSQPGGGAIELELPDAPTPSAGLTLHF
jgi:tetratricopeptide (TPR) repeat protein